ncbi:MAG: hypothetical protein QHH13_07875 [Melioribacter sp.]|uniref:hypothetical protein n=1 Tax=Rosettibacter primus TaxID=3111523 RepID=UPI00247C8484|nr:hypothetical protein [Melioribacter sp.]
MRNIIIILLFVLSLNYGQQKDPLMILNAVKEKFELIRDYEVDAEIKFDITSVKMPESKIKIFFKQPNKFKIQSESFVMLPKHGLNFFPSLLIKDDFAALYVRSELLNNKKCDVVKIIPNSDTTDIILSTLWIDTNEKVIRKIETVTKKSGTIRIELTYDEKASIVLPSKVKFNFGEINSRATNIPEQQKENGNFKRKLRQPISGVVTIIYSNYKINKGLSDSIFNQTEIKRNQQ